MRAKDFRGILSTIESAWAKGKVRFVLNGTQFTADDFTADVAKFDSELAGKVTNWLDAGAAVSSHISEKMKG